MTPNDLTPEQIIETLGMERHPEGGWFVQTFRDGEGPEGRGHSTAIYYLLREGERSHWHRVDAVEIWHWHGGAPLELSIGDEANPVERHVLGMNLGTGERPQVVVPKGHWQSARSLGAWTLVGCTVSPGFVYSGFELAPEGFDPGR